MNTVRVDPKLIPECDYDRGCAVLYASITRLLADPVRRREFEEWEKQYLAAKETGKTGRRCRA